MKTGKVGKEFWERVASARAITTIPDRPEAIFALDDEYRRITGKRPAYYDARLCCWIEYGVVRECSHDPKCKSCYACNHPGEEVD